MLAYGFQSTISLGTVLVGMIVVALFFIGTLKDRQTGRWRDLYELADKERKELQEDLNEYRDSIGEMQQQIGKLEALQMPVRVVESLHESADAAAQRQVMILDHLEKHEKSAETRSRRTLALLQLIADRLGPDPDPLTTQC